MSVLLDDTRTSLYLVYEKAHRTLYKPGLLVYSDQHPRDDDGWTRAAKEIIDLSDESVDALNKSKNKFFEIETKMIKKRMRI